MLLEQSCACLAVLTEVRSKGLEAACSQAAHSYRLPVPAAGSQQPAACAAVAAEHAAFVVCQAPDLAAERPAGGLGTHLHAMQVGFDVAALCNMIKWKQCHPVSTNGEQNGC